MDIFSDRADVSSLPYNVQEILKREGLVGVRGQKVSFSGLINTPEKSFIFMPRQTPHEKKYIPRLFEAIRKYSSEVSTLREADDDGCGLTGLEPLSIIYQILSDYRLNGIYTRRDSHSALNKGKPNWGRTIDKYSPYLSSKGPVYVDYVGSSSHNQSDTEASRIHSYIVKALDERYGDILFAHKSYTEDGLLPPRSQDSYYLESVIKAELQQLYSDRDVQLFKFILQYLNKYHGNQNSTITTGIQNFHTLWEHMLRKTVSGAVDLNSKFSIPTYVDLSGKIQAAPRKGQRTDLIVHCPEKDLYSIVDAKYYDAKHLNSVPGWNDLLKQFFYAKAVHSLYPRAKVKNYFIFPSTEPVFEYAYMANREDKNMDENYETISCLYVDPIKVINAFIEDRVLEDVSQKLIT